MKPEIRTLGNVAHVIQNQQKMNLGTDVVEPFDADPSYDLDE